MMHDKGQEIDPFGIGLYFELWAFPGEFDKAGPELANSVKVGPLNLGIFPTEHKGDYCLCCLIVPELAIRNEGYRLICIREFKSVVLLELDPQHWHP